MIILEWKIDLSAISVMLRTGVACSRPFSSTGCSGCEGVGDTVIDWLRVGMDDVCKAVLEKNWRRKDGKRVLET